MTDQDLFAFTGLIKRLAAVFRVRTDTEDFRLLTSSYFRVLARHSIPDLERGADAWIAAQDKFPKPAEWAMAIPSREAFIEEMTDAQSQQHLEAERASYERPACTCADCERFHVAHLPQRYVPDTPERRVKEPSSGRIVLVGHWAHGQELRRFYDQKSAFWSHAEKHEMQKAVKKALPVMATHGRPMVPIGRSR